MNNKYPIFVISKGRSKNCLTVRELEKMNVTYKLVIEPQEYDDYVKITHPDNILTLPFSNLGQGSIPARNYVWEYAIKEGHDKHWILDDNIEGFHRLNHNMKPKVTSGTIFKCAEDFTDRYTNVAISGMNYYSFCKNTDKVPAFYVNTRIYSCILIKNSLPYRWRGRYNEDTDLSIRALKDGHCTILFNAFLVGKVTTMRMKGGNTDNVYTDKDDRLKFAKALEDLHPDIVKTVWKFNRWHHQVNYKGFKKNKLKIRKDIEVVDTVNNYGMVLTEKKDE